MTLDGGLTAEGTVNANGGINIPLTVGAQTGTAAVNRLYAAGMAGVTDIYTQHVYLNTGAITATGTRRQTSWPIRTVLLYILSRGRTANGIIPVSPDFLSPTN